MRFWKKRKNKEKHVKKDKGDRFYWFFDIVEIILLPFEMLFDIFKD